MTSPMMDPVAVAALADAADANFALHASWVAQRTPVMHVHAESGLLLVDSGLPCDTFNVVCRGRLAAGQVSAPVHAAISYFHRVKRPFAWWVGPADQPAHLGKMLARAGLHVAETELAMAVDLASLTTGERAPAELEIRRVQTPAELHDFAGVVAANWTPPDREVLQFYELAAPTLLATDSPLWLYVGYLMDRPVAAAEGVVGAGVVGLYNICTRQEYRRRGNRRLYGARNPT